MTAPEARAWEAVSEEYRRHVTAALAALDVRNRTALLAVDLIESLFGKSTLMREHQVRKSTFQT